ncbi:STAS domain-containing protein [Nonomuraea sp. NPDC050404]|uniref:STAS domain-containing protein n=1 Tax=Nonomuraea sp. NPDC050404 TaxID=3155783 RepID=UPI0033F6B557
MTAMTTAVHDIAGGPVLEIAGDLDHHSAPEAVQAVQDIMLTAGQQLIVDLAGLTFCDSSGIATLIAAYNKAAEVGAGMALACVPASVNRTLAIIGMARLIAIHPTVQAAAEQWRSQ